MHVLSSSAIAALAFVGSANAWFRLTCGLPAIQTRADPIVQPGIAPSYHVHTVHGAKNFRSNATYDTLRASSCTSCAVTQDLSSYWFPKLYYKNKSGQFEAVPNGGLTAYYLQRGDGDKANGGSGLKAFPPGFKMIGGNALRRAKKFTSETGSQEELRERATKWECLRYTTSNPGYNGYGFPTTDCEAGFRAQLHFPACWDGKNLDSADHISHTAYLSGLDNGKCPSTHPVPLMLMFYEVTWDIHSFVVSGRWNPATDGWPFVYANGDPTGHGWHGDFQNGWDTTVLQTAIDKCNDPSNDTINGVASACQYLKLQDPGAAPANTCKPTAEINENVGATGPLAKLPGCNPLQAGPADAKVYTAANCPA